MRCRSLFGAAFAVISVVSPWSPLMAAPLSGQVFGWGFNGNGEATGTPSPDAHPSLPDGLMSCRDYYEVRIAL